MNVNDLRAPGYQRIREIPSDRLPALVHAPWIGLFPWLVQGTTVRGPGENPFDLGVFGSPGGDDEAVRRNWSRLRDGTGSVRVLHARQVHGARVHVHGPTGRRAPDGEDERLSAGGASGVEGSADLHEHECPELVQPCDGHVTSTPGVLLAVATADCVPVFVVDPAHRAVALLHAGWRGAAVGVLEAGLRSMASAFGSRPEEAHVHLGPAICGDCYEVGPEVFEALGLPVPSTPSPVDLRGALIERAWRAGVSPARTTASEHCTRCTDSGLFSHRGGDPQRQVGFLGLRAG